MCWFFGFDIDMILSFETLLSALRSPGSTEFSNSHWTIYLASMHSFLGKAPPIAKTVETSEVANACVFLVHGHELSVPTLRDFGYRLRIE